MSAASQSVSFATPLNGRFVVMERYKGGAVKQYLDTVTGAKLTAKDYRKLKADGYLENHPGVTLSPDPASVADDTQADPAPRPLRAAPETGMGPEDSRTAGSVSHSRGAGLLETMASGVATILSAVAGALAPAAPILTLTPPPPLSTPVLRPLCRIVDRHMPINATIELTDDGRDLLEAAEAFSACTVYMWNQWQELDKLRGRRAERIDQYADDGRSDERASRNERASHNGHRADSGIPVAQGQAATPGSIWAKLPAQFRPQQSTDGQAAASMADSYQGDSQSESGADYDLAGYHRPDAARSAALVRGLLQADADGRARAGLF